MSHLLRHHAPLTAETWQMIDDEASSRLRSSLGARRLVDFSGPLGWEHSATSTGRVGAVVAAPAQGVTAQSRVVLPLAEVRADFSLSRAEMEAAARGAVDVDLSPLDDAAFRLACAENAAIIDGWAALGISGIVPSSTQSPVPIGDEYSALPLRTAAAVAALRSAGIDGPYGLALDAGTWISATGGSDAGGSPMLPHLEQVLGGTVALTPGIASPVVISLRGGDFLFESGQDISVGYDSHDADHVRLYLQETFSFRVATPEAAVALATN